MRFLPLADEFFLVGQDEYTGKPFVNGTIFDTALGGGLLGELLLDGRVAIVDGKVAVREPRRTGEAVTDAVLGDLLREREAHPVRIWVEYLREDARDRVGGRLAASGLVRREQGRSLALRTVVRFPGVDPMAAALPRVRLSNAIDRGDALNAQATVLAALVGAAGLEHVLALDMTRQQIRETLIELTATLPPALAVLAAGAEAAVAAVALTVRR